MDNIVRGANWFFNEINTWRVLDSVNLPDLVRATEQFMPGGHMFGADFPEGFNPLQAEINLHNDAPELRGMCGREPGDYITASYYENLLSFRTGQNKGRTISMKGLINEVKGGRRQGMKKAGTTYRFSTIVSYLDSYDGRVVHKFDLFAGPGATIVDGKSPFAAMAANLALSSGTVL